MNDIDLISMQDLKYVYTALAIITGIPSTLYITPLIIKAHKNKTRTVPTISIAITTTIVIVILSIKYPMLAYCIFAPLLTPITSLLLDTKIENNKKT